MLTLMGTEMRAIGYVRVSTNKQEIGPEVQIAALTEEAARRGWSLDIRREDAASAKSLQGRPVLADALADLKAGRADVLAVAKLDRLSRSVADFARILEDAERQRWHVACLDLGVDTTTITGRAMAHVTATFAEMERRRIGERTREGMARIKAENPDRHMGRPVTLSPRRRGPHRRAPCCWRDTQGDRRDPDRRGRAERSRRPVVALDRRQGAPPSYRVARAGVGQRRYAPRHGQPS